MPPPKQYREARGSAEKVDSLAEFMKGERLARGEGENGELDKVQSFGRG
jgi:hypothetical protein